MEVMNEKELELINAVAKIKKLKQQIDDLEKEKSILEDLIKDEMTKQDTDTLILGDGVFKVTWKEVSSDKFDSAAFKKEHNDLYEQYVKTSSYKRFAVK